MLSGKWNILIVHNYYQIPGGEDTVVANEKDMLEEHGHKVILYKRSNSELDEMNAFQKICLPFNTVFNFRTYKEIKEIIVKEKIDIVHVHNTLHLISPSVYYAAKSCGITLVQTIHNFRLLCPGATFYRDGHICEKCVEEGMINAIKYNCYRDSKLQTLACVITTKIHRMTGIYGQINYICLTDFNRSKLLGLKQIKESQVFVKPNFNKSLNENSIVKNRKNRYIFAGRLDRLKGIDFLLNTWKMMGEKAPELIVCGTGPLAEWCEKFIEENKLHSVRLLGFVPNTEIRKLIAESKALILPTQWYEGFPMSVIESFSVGTPVICSDLGNAGSIVIEGINGFKFKTNNSEKLIGAMMKIDKCKDIYKTTLDDYDRRYTDTENYSLLIKIYDQLKPFKRDCCL